MLVVPELLVVGVVVLAEGGLSDAGVDSVPGAAELVDSSGGEYGGEPAYTAVSDSCCGGDA